MSKLSNGIHELCNIDTQAGKNQWINRIHPLVKLFITILYVTLVVSFDKYHLMELLGMGLYPLIVFLISDIHFGDCVKRIRYILPIILIIGIFNPFFDHKMIIVIGSVTITGGMVSMATLMIKGIFSVLAVYLLVITTTIEKICYGLRSIHIPQMVTTSILLTYRYINVLLKETERITQAYALRAPKQKGVHFKAWGSLIGQLLLRSMDRGTDIYDSMCLRGYENREHRKIYNEVRMNSRDTLWLVVWTLVIIGLYTFPVFTLVGNLVI